MSAPGRRISLRPFEEADAEALHPIFSDAEAMAFWSTPPHASIEETHAFVRATIDATQAGVGDDQVVVLDGRVIGKAGLWDGQEIGFILARDVWGRGLAREAVEAVIMRARGRGNERITADVDPRNTASLTLLAKLGFIKTGEAKATMKVGDLWVDSVFLELRLKPPSLPT
ncbi:MAG TPA: GNAT family protein [Caulobacteraceae bacterium]|jgi:RimJ/RimL family protein N-acetyltransferase